MGVVIQLSEDEALLLIEIQPQERGWKIKNFAITTKRRGDPQNAEEGTKNSLIFQKEKASKNSG